MNIGALIIIAAALCIDSGIISLTVGLQKNVKNTRGLRLAVICALCQGGLFLAGMLFSLAFKKGFDSYDHWAAFVVLFIIGLKMLLEIRKADSSAKEFDVTHTLVLFGLGLATSIDALIVGFGLGMTMASIFQKIFSASIVFVLTFIFSISGFYLGRKHKFVPVKFSTAVGAFTLIGFSIKILFDHGVF